jgi:hypothetical protein
VGVDALFERAPVPGLPTKSRPIGLRVRVSF